MKSIMIVSVIIIAFLKCYAAEPELKLVNVIFRHGDRTPTSNSRFPTDPYYNYDFYPDGYGALTNSGKLRMYKFGELLRDRYKSFLGDVYLPELLSARSTDYDRTKMSLQLVLAALFPPTSIQKWHGSLNYWQPIPTTYVTKRDDDMLVTIYQSKFLAERNRVEMKEDIKNRTENFREFMAHLSNLTGKMIVDSLDMKSIYDTLVAESYMNLTIPDWTKGIFPDGKLYDGVLLHCDIISYDSHITNALIGKLMLKITSDMIALRDNEKSKKKLFLYAGHEVNIIGVLRSLNVYESHVPEYSSAVVIELFEDNHKYFVKVLYYRGIPAEFIELKMPECPTLCPFEEYLSVVNNMLENTNIK